MSPAHNSIASMALVSSGSCAPIRIRIMPRWVVTREREVGYLCFTSTRAMEGRHRVAGAPMLLKYLEMDSAPRTFQISATPVEIASDLTTGTLSASWPKIPCTSRQSWKARHTHIHYYAYYVRADRLSMALKSESYTISLEILREEELSSTDLPLSYSPAVTAIIQAIHMSRVLFRWSDYRFQSQVRS